MKYSRFAFTGILCLGFMSMVYSPVRAQDYYFPPKGEWEKISPGESGMDKTRLASAVSFALENEYSGSRDLRIAIVKGFEREPYHKIAAATKKRGGPAGIILKNGYIVAEWGDPSRVDMTFSVTKSYLSTVAGLALDEWRARELHEPGTHYKYNDVRVNVLAYSLLQVWRKPLPVVLREKVMDPVGASSTWRWYGYESSWVNVDGAKIQSVSGRQRDSPKIFFMPPGSGGTISLLTGNMTWL